MLKIDYLYKLSKFIRLVEESSYHSTKYRILCDAPEIIAPNGDIELLRKIHDLPDSNNIYDNIEFIEIDTKRYYNQNANEVALYFYLNDINAGVTIKVYSCCFSDDHKQEQTILIHTIMSALYICCQKIPNIPNIKTINFKIGYVDNGIKSLIEFLSNNYSKEMIRSHITCCNIYGLQIDVDYLINYFSENKLEYCIPILLELFKEDSTNSADTIIL